MNWALYFTVVLALICVVLLLQMRPRMRRLEKQVGELSSHFDREEQDEED